jgi:RHH-type transcriptional regulator, proline utilization regulon repressor / proline dehydrogenase / delta 1-pyrroline-5-carboxylate dehydrogenase
MQPVRPSLEPEIRRIGEQLARLSAGQAPTMFNRRWWSQAAINLAMHDSAFKTQLFRFIDVLPCVVDDARVVTLAQEYLGDVSTQIFGAQWGLHAVAATRLGARLTGKAIRSQVEQMARSFIAGGTLDEAEPVLEDLWTHGRAWSVDLLGEATISDREADRYRDRCLKALRELTRAASQWPSMSLLERDHLGPVPRVQLSIKISALSPHLDAIDPDGSYRSVAARLRPILDLAMTCPASLIFDMEQAETKDLLIEIFIRLFSEPGYRSYPHMGLALQAYHRETQRDIDHLLAWVRQRAAPITIRLVKGAYWDSDTIRYRQRGWPVPLFEHKSETDANYETLTQTLLTHATMIRPAFGTHNLRTLAYIEALAESLKLSPETWEYQMIFGMAEPFQQAVTQHGRRLRLYTPIGDLLPGMAYLVRRLLENTSNESFLRKEYVESQPLMTLLAPPSAEGEARETAATHQIAGEGGFQNEPTSNFADADRRVAIHAALTTVRTQLGREWASSIGGVSPTGPLIESRNPSRPDEVVGRVTSARPGDVEQAVRGALKGWQGWRETAAGHRIDILRRAASLMRKQRDELTAWEIFECGKPWREADADIAEAIDFLEFYAAEWHRLAPPARLGHEPGELNHRWYHSRGVTAVIAPWNFPLAIPTGMVSAALVTGNPVLFKPSERSSVLGQLLTDVLREAGVPDDVLCCLTGGPEIGRTLVQHPDIATIAFTGSKDVGLSIMRDAAIVAPGQTMVKRVIAEMGGKNAIIVDETADLDEAITGIVNSFTGYAGQKCSACSRAIVHASIYDLFLERLREAVLSVIVGNPEEPGTQVGPVIDSRAQAKIKEYIAMGKQDACLVVERAVAGPGWHVGPTVIADVEPTHRLAQEEIFGPVLVVMKAGSFQEALTVANTTAYALTGGVYSRSPDNLALAQQQFDVGNLYLNRPITGALVGRQPFGGYRLSGVGSKAGGQEYLTQFVVTRIISENTLRRGFAPIE